MLTEIIMLLVQFNIHLAILFFHMICEDSIVNPRIISEVMQIAYHIIVEVPCE